MKKSNKQYLFEMVAAAVLVALKVVLDRFLSYNVWNQRFGFSFIAVAFAGAMLGAPWAMAVGGLGDIVGALLFPAGPYFPGFTLPAVLTALCTALFIRINASLLRITLSVLINQFFGSVILNSVWISILYGKGFVALIPSRILQSGIMTVLQITLIYLLFGEKSVIRRRLSRLPAFS